jgi:hypothetical protein
VKQHGFGISQSLIVLVTADLASTSCAVVNDVHNDSINVDTYGTLEAEWTDEKLIALINYNFDLRYHIPIQKVYCNLLKLNLSVVVLQCKHHDFVVTSLR